MPNAYVLLSGGIDSTTCLYLAARDFQHVTGISAFYGQRHDKEIESARNSCYRLGFLHHVLDLSALVPETMLTDTRREVPTVSYSDITGVSPTYVPFRNGLLLSAAAAFIQGERARISTTPEDDEWVLYFGAHAEDAHNWAYPDCCFEWTGAMANAIYVGTYRQLRLLVPLQWLKKRDIIRIGHGLGVPWEETWSCYRGGRVHCGVCPTCRARRDGFREAGIKDPTMYGA